MFALILGSALAADTVVHAADPADAARAHAAKAGGVDPASLETVALSVLQTRAPVGLEGARVLPCTDAPTRPSDIEVHLTAAEGAYLYMEGEKATSELALAATALNCLATPLEPALASRVWYLRGLVAFAANDVGTAEQSFYRARVFVPDLAWDEDFAPDARPLFERTAVQLKVAEPSWLTIVPPVDTLRVDGRPVVAAEARLPLPPGPHVVQIGPDHPITLTVDLKGDGTLVVPSLLPPTALGWAADPLHQDALSSTFAATLRRDTVVYVADAGGVWRVRAGRDDWAELDPPDAAARVAPPRPVLDARGKRRVAGRWVAVAGGAVLAAGGTYAGIQMAQAWAAYDDGTSATTMDAYTAAEAVYRPARQRMVLGDAVAAGGAALLGVGIALAW